jgi:nitronate monooxygenase
VILDQLRYPVVLAPLAGGPSTPELAAAVTNAGGLGFLGSGYLSSEATKERIVQAKQLTDGPLGVNVFSPSPKPTEPSRLIAYVEHLRRWAEQNSLTLGEPEYSDDDWEAKLSLLASGPVEVVSFTFGCPPREVIELIRSAGSEVWVTITTPDEARQAADLGANVLVVQGSEAGGHRGSFTDHPRLPVYGLLALLQLTRHAVAVTPDAGAPTPEAPVPLVASGGIATGAALAAVLCAGARAAQIGSAFMLAPEAGTTAAHRAALKTQRSTALTRAFTGRLARGISNEFMAAHEEHAAVGYPEVHYVTAPLRARAREQGNPELINLWAGEAHELARERPAAEIVQALVRDARAALKDASELMF